MAEDEPHIALTRLWCYRADLNSTDIPLEERMHLATCQDCIAVVWLCRTLPSLHEASATLRDYNVALEVESA